MNIQLIGTKKDQNCRKGERFLKERGISFHFRDLTQKEFSPGEWDKILQQHDAALLINEESKSFKKKQFAFKVYDPAEELREDSTLLNIPVLRIDNKFYIGFEEKQWKSLL